MNKLLDRIQCVQCGIHNYPIQYICIDEICQYQFRGLCLLCFNGNQIVDHYDLKNIVVFLTAEQRLRSAIRRFKIQLIYFLTCALKINVEAISEHKLLRIKQLQGDLQSQDKMKRLNQLCRQKQFTQESISELGLYITIQHSASIAQIVESLLRNEVEDIEAYCQSTKLTIRSLLLNRKWKVQNINTQLIRKKPLYKLKQRIELGQYLHIIKFSNNESQILLSFIGFIWQFDFMKNKVKRSSQVTVLARQQFISYLCSDKNETYLGAVCQACMIIYRKHSVTGIWKQHQILRTIDNLSTYATFSEDSRTLVIANTYYSRLFIYQNSQGNWKLFRAIKLNYQFIEMFYTMDQCFVIANVGYITTYDSQYLEIQTQNLRNVLQIPLVFHQYQINKQLNTIVQALGELIAISQLNNITKQWSRQLIVSNHVERIEFIFRFNNDSSMFLSISDDLLTVWIYDNLIGKWKIYQKLRQQGGQRIKDMIVSKDFTTVLTISCRGIISVYSLEGME